MLYTGLRDELFGVPGEWSIFACTSSDCGHLHLWPHPDDLSAAYLHYYTHVRTQRAGLPRPLASVYRLWRTAIGLERARARMSTLGLEDFPPGRLLDVGAGRGEMMARFAHLGWEVDGLEPDPLAANEAQESYGFSILTESIEAAKLPGEQYDAITLNHVIEHIEDPRAGLENIRRALKRTGVLAIATPNATSLGHKVYRSKWRGLEPPRHLNIFSPRSLQELLVQAGFRVTRLETVSANAEAITRSGLEDSGRRRGSQRVEPFLLQHVEYLLRPALPQIGEEILVHAQRA